MKRLCEWFTGGKKLALGGMLLLIAIMVIGLGGASGNKGYLGFLIAMAGISCFWNVVLSKINHCNINIFGYILLLIVPICAGISLSQVAKGSILIGVVIICCLVNFLGMTFFIQCENIFKRFVMGILSLLMNAFTGVLFFVLLAFLTMPSV